MRREGATPDEYLAALSGWQRVTTERLREIVRSAVPELVESVRAGFIYYEQDGDIFALAAQKHHVALYVFVPEVMTARRELLTGIDCGKGCIRFRAQTEIPESALRLLLGEAVVSEQRDCGKG